MPSAHPRWIPAVALLFCAAGVAGLFLPVVLVGTTGADGGPSVVLRGIDVPGGWSFVVMFVVLSGLPLVDLLRPRLRLTVALLVLATIGLFWLVMSAQMAGYYLDAVRRSGRSLPDAAAWSLGIGSGYYVLVVADIGLLVAGALAASAGRRRAGAARY